MVTHSDCPPYQTQRPPTLTHTATAYPINIQLPTLPYTATAYHTTHCNCRPHPTQRLPTLPHKTAHSTTYNDCLPYHRIITLYTFNYLPYHIQRVSTLPYVTLTNNCTTHFSDRGGASLGWVKQRTQYCKYASWQGSRKPRSRKGTESTPASVDNTVLTSGLTMEVEAVTLATYSKRWTASRGDSRTTHATILSDSMSLLQKVKSGMVSLD